MRSALALVVAGAPFACVLPEFDPLGLPCPCADEYVCDEASNTCVAGPLHQGAGGAGAAGGGGGSGAQGAGAAGAGGAGGAGGGGIALSPLEVQGTIGSGSVAFGAEGLFRLVATSGTNWQFTSWYDLASDSAGAVDLAALDSGPLGREVLYEPFWTAAPRFSSENSTLLMVTLVDERPVRATLQAEIDYVNTPGLRVQSRYTVYASGRVATQVDVSTSGPTVALSDSEYHHLTVNEALAFSALSLSGGNAAALVRTDGATPAPNVLIANRSGNPNVATDAAGFNWYWRSGAITFNPGDVSTFVGEVRLSPSGLSAAELNDHAADALSGSLSIASGAMGASFDEATSAHVMTMTTPPVAFAPDASVARFSPVFQIVGWTSPTFVVELGGEVIASDQQPVTDRAIARFEPGDGSLLLLYGGSIPAGEPLAARTFTVTP